MVRGNTFWNLLRDYREAGGFVDDYLRHHGLERELVRTAIFAKEGLRQQPSFDL